MTPTRIQRSRKKGWRMPPNTICVSRPSKWGNPFRVGMWRDYSAEDAVRDYKLWFNRDPSKRSCEMAFGKPPNFTDVLSLRGKNLACWCKIGSPCHAHWLLKIANSTLPDVAEGA